MGSTQPQNGDSAAQGAPAAEVAIARAILNQPVDPTGAQLPPVPPRAELPELRKLGDAAIERIRTSVLSMLDEARLKNLMEQVVERRGGTGALVECGVARGGALALMAYLAGRDQTVWGFDSFEALPPLTPEDAGSGEAWVGITCSGPDGEDAVRKVFRSLGVPMDGVRLVKGWFEASIAPLVPEVGAIDVLRVDSDWYQSVRFCLETLYPSVSEGGVVIIDDYFKFVGCRAAVDEFRTANRISAALEATDGGNEAWWVRAASDRP